MSRIRDKNTIPEILLKRALRARNLLGYRTNYLKMLGKPDIVFTKNKVAIFIDGDFWQGYNWKVRGKIPPKGYWQQKIVKNINRDRFVARSLRHEGWKVVRFWEHEVKRNSNVCTQKILKTMK